MPIQLKNYYQEVPEVEDVETITGTIDNHKKKTLQNWAIFCGCCLLTGLLMLWGFRFSFDILMPPLLVYQTSMKYPEDRLSLIDSATMSVRGFNVGLLAFGNTICNKIIVAIDAEQGFACKPPSSETSAHFTINSKKTYQSILGFGGAFTESSAINFFKLPKEVQDKVIQLYFSAGDVAIDKGGGIGYTLGRVHINSCDFSLESYSFNEIDGDYSMEYFDSEVTHDNAFIMPLIRLASDAVAATSSSSSSSPFASSKEKGRHASTPSSASSKLHIPPSSKQQKQLENLQQEQRLRILASPWSPPKWMKRPVRGHQNMTGSAAPSCLIDDSRIKRAWALYLSKFVSAYQDKGIPVWAMTVQNEPGWCGWVCFVCWCLKRHA
jgi:hypothetical protein